MKRDNIFKPLLTFIIVLLVTVIVVMLCSGSLFESETVESETVETTEVESNSLYEERFSSYDENITASKNKEVFLFSTYNEEEFLNFLEDFDYVSYEIIERIILPATAVEVQKYIVLYTTQYF